MLPVPRISGHLQRIKLPASVHSLSKIRSDHIGHYCLSKMVGPGNAHILGRFPLTGSRLLCHILVLLHKRYKITQNLPLVHKTGEGTCLTKEAVGTCGVQVKSHWSIPFPFLGLYVHGPYDVNILDVITFYRSVIQLLFTGGYRITKIRPLNVIHTTAWSQQRHTSVNLTCFYFDFQTTALSLP